MAHILSSQLILNAAEIRSAGSDRKNLERFVGKKAVGLTLLPAAWSPRFFVISTSAHRLLIGASHPQAMQPVNAPSAILHDAIGPALKLGLENLAGDHVIVRSSSPTESLGHRGLYLSGVCDATVAAVVDQAVKILFHGATVQNSLASSGSESLMAVVVQKLVTANARGHLS